MHRNRNVGQNRLGTRRCDHDSALGRVAIERIPHVPQRCVAFDVLDFSIRDRRLTLRIPVHKAFAAVDQSLTVQLHEHAGHCGNHTVVHRKPRALPIRAEAEQPKLLIDRAAVLARPFPRARDKRRAPCSVTGRAVRGKFLDDQRLRRDCGMI